MKSALAIALIIVVWALLIPNSWKKQASRYIEQRTYLYKGYLVLSRYVINNLKFLFLGSAAITVFARLLVPIGITSDMSIQVGTALNFLSGDGFGTFILSEELADTTALNVLLLTKFPPALSIALAFLMRLGLSAGWALKLIYSVATLAGWFGWGLLLQLIIHRSAQDRLKYIVSSQLLLSLGLAVFLPISFTPNWNGTDIFLWSGFPFVIHLLVDSQEQSGAKRNSLLLKAGLLVGFLYSVRYAAMFLVVGALIWFARRLSLAQVLRTLYFLVGFLFFYIPISVYKKAAANNAFGSGSISTETLSNSQLLANKFRLILDYKIFREYINNLVILLSSNLKLGPVLSFVLALFFFAGMVLLVYVLYRERRLGARNRYPLAALVSVIGCFVLGHSALLFSAFFLSSAPRFLLFLESRYYYSLFPAFLFLCFAVTCYPLKKVALLNSKMPLTAAFKLVQIVVSICIATVLLLSARSFTASTSLIYGNGYSASPTVLQLRNSGNNIVTRTPASKLALTELLKENEDAIAISYADDFDFYHIASQQIRRRISPAYDQLHWPSVEPFPWSQHQTQSDAELEPLIVYLIFRKQEGCKTYCAYRNSEEVDLQAFSELRSVYLDPTEGIEILEGALQQ